MLKTRQGLTLIVCFARSYFIESACSSSFSCLPSSSLVFWVFPPSSLISCPRHPDQTFTGSGLWMASKKANKHAKRSSDLGQLCALLREFRMFGLQLADVFRQRLIHIGDRGRLRVGVRVRFGVIVRVGIGVRVRVRVRVRVNRGRLRGEIRVVIRHQLVLPSLFSLSGRVSHSWAQPGSTESPGG